MIPGSANALLAYKAGSSQYQISRSLRFNSADSAYLSRTPASAGNRKTWTWAGWVKRSQLVNGTLMSVAGSANETDYLRLHFSGDLLYLGTGLTNLRVTTALLRDVAAWYHIVAAVDTTQATAGNRVRVYVNGVEITAFTISNNPTQNADLAFNSVAAHNIGRVGTSVYFDGYLADIHFIDGQALTPSSFGEFDSNNVWQPKAYSGSYGTNGFHLDFADNSNNTAATLGKDISGNGNNWTPNNFSVTSSPVTSLRYATIASTYPAIPGTSNQTGLSFSNTWTVGTILGSSLGSRIIFDTGGNGNAVDITPQVSSGNCAGSDDLINWTETQSTGAGTFSTKRYWWVDSNLSAYSGLKLESVTPNYAGNDSLVDSPTNYGTDTGAGGEVRGNYATFNPLACLGTFSNGNLQMSVGSGGESSGLGSIALPQSGKWYWEVAIDTVGSDPYTGISNGSSTYNLGTAYVSYRAAGTFNSVPAASNPPSAATYTSGDILGLAYNADSLSLAFYKNGALQGTTTGITAGQYFPACYSYNQASRTFNFGQRPFAYTAPSGYKALCSTNLPTPTILNGATAMDVVTYTGTGSTLTPTSSLGFSPDLVWIKSRSAATDNTLYDIVRGAQARLESNNTDAEVTTDGGLTAFNSNGFTLGTLAQVNTNTTTYAAWCWDAGSSTVTNTAGTIQSSVRANASAGFSIVTYAGTGANATVGHGLGVAPSFYIVKRRNAGATSWNIYHASIGATKVIRFSSAAESTEADIWNNTAPTSSVFSIGTSAEVNPSTSNNVVAYCFAPVAGYSAFGSYTGNGSADGPFVYTNMRSRWIMIKRTDTTGNWTIIDTAREGYNIDNDPLYPNLSDAEGTADLADILGNGFKLRTTDASVNANTGTYVYATFSENPFSISRAR